MYSFLIRHVFYPAWEMASGRKTLHYLREFENNQWKNAEDIKKIQNGKLNKMLSHAYDNVPYYREQFHRLRIRPEDIHDAADLARIPVINKDIIRDNFEEFTAKNSDQIPHMMYPTGGTTGRPFHFLKDKDTFDHQNAAAFRAWKWAGLNIGIRYMLIWGHSFDMRNEKKIKTRINRLLTDNQIFFPCFKLTDAIFEKYAKILLGKKPKFLMGYPSPIQLFGRFLKSRNITYNPKGIITTAEKLYPHQREELERQFGCKVFDDYGSRETSVRASECDKHEGYHIASENGIIEIIDNGLPAHDGQIGKVIITDLNNYSMPLIRYENGDMAVASSRQCSCGRGLPLLKHIIGRESDIFVTPDGKYIPGEVFVHAFLDFEGDQYQVVQKRIDEIVIKIVRGKHFDEKAMGTIKTELEKWLGDKIRINIDYVDRIPVPESGKRRYVISEVPMQFR